VVVSQAIDRSIHQLLSERQPAEMSGGQRRRGACVPRLSHGLSRGLAEGGNSLQPCGFAHAVKRLPEPRAQVQFLPGALKIQSSPATPPGR
jgi:hypothetical protein